MSRKVLIHVEDPGAANWIVALLPELGARGLQHELIAEGAAVDYLRARGVDGRARGNENDANFLLVGTSENLMSSGLALIDTARARGIPCAAIVDQAANAEHRFRGTTRDPLRHLPDWLLLPDRRAAQKFAELGVQSERCIVVGNPHYDRVLAVGRELAREGHQAVRKRAFPNAPLDRPIVMFVSEVGYVVNPEAAAWEAANAFVGRGTTMYRTIVILEEVLDALSTMQPRPWVVLRLHPKNSVEEFAAISEELDAVSAGGDPIPAVFAADVVIGMTSVLLEEAKMLGRPTLAILPRPQERDWLSMIADGRIPSVGSRAELRAAIPAMLEARCDAPAFEIGTAAGRIADFVCRMTHVSHPVSG